MNRRKWCQPLTPYQGTGQAFDKEMMKRLMEIYGVEKKLNRVSEN